jgi:hypothetical protein
MPSFRQGLLRQVFSDINVTGKVSAKTHETWTFLDKRHRQVMFQNKRVGPCLNHSLILSERHP